MRKRARRRLDPLLELERKELMSLDVISLLGPQASEIWMQASQVPSVGVVLGYDNNSSSTSNGGSFTVGNTTDNWTTTSIVNDSGSISGNILTSDTHTINGSTNSSADTVDDPNTSSDSGGTTDIELLAVTTLQTDEYTPAWTSFTLTTKVTSNGDNSTTPAGSTTPSHTDGTHVTYVLVQTGTVDSQGNITGTYTLTMSGGDGTSDAGPLGNGSDTGDDGKDDSWTLTATGNLGTSWDPGTWSMSYGGDDYLDWNGTSGLTGPGPVNPGENQQYGQTDTITASANGAGSTTPIHYSVSVGGTGTAHDFTVMGGEDYANQAIVEADDTIDEVITYLYTNSDGAGAVTESETGSESFTGTVTPVTGGTSPEGFTASNSNSGSITVNPGDTVASVLGAGVWGLYVPVPPPITPVGVAPPVGVPYKWPPTNNLDVYYNALAMMWNSGKGKVWYFSGSAPSPNDPPGVLAAPPDFATQPIMAPFSGEYPCLGRADDPDGLNFKLGRWFSGVVLIPYTGAAPDGSLGGIIVQTYWWGWCVDLWDTKDAWR